MTCSATARTILRTGFAITYYPEQPSASNMIGQQVPYTISQNVSFATNPTDFSTVRTIADPFPAIVPGEAAHDRGAAGGQPARARAFVRERDTLRRAVAPRHRPPAVRRDGARAHLRGKRRQAHRVLLQPQRGAAWDWHAGIPPLDSATQPIERHAAMRSQEQLQLSQRPAEAHPAFPQRAAASRELHVREVARLRRVGGERRRRGRAIPRPSRTSGRDTVHPGSTCAIAPWSAGSTSCRGDPTGTGCARAAFSAKSSEAGSLPGSRR